MRGHQLLDLADDLRTRAKEDGTDRRPEPEPCVVCGARSALVIPAPYGIGPAAGYCLPHFRARRVTHGA